MIKKKNKPYLFGDLLVKAGMVQAKTVADALGFSRNTGLPIGRVLVGWGAISEENVKAALSAQSLVRDLMVPSQLAIDALRMVGAGTATFDEALRRLGYQSEYFEVTNKLGQLLRDAQLIDDRQLDEALNTCFSSGLQLGRVLVHSGTLSTLTAYAALTAQILVRDGKISREQAISALRLAAEHRSTIEDSLNMSGFKLIQDRGSIRLGELLVLAELVSEDELLSAIERGLVDETPIGEVLVAANFITEEELKNALTLQKEVSLANLDPIEAADILAKAKREGSPLDVLLEAAAAEKAQKAAPPLQLSLEEMLVLVGIIQQDELAALRAKSKTAGTALEKLLLAQGTLSRDALDVINRCQFLVNIGNLTVEEAIFALHVWYWGSESFDSLLRRLGWPKRPSV